jgi:hypothetical protein
LNLSDWDVLMQEEDIKERWKENNNNNNNNNKIIKNKNFSLSLSNTASCILAVF